MIPVHVIVSERVEDEQSYGAAFNGAIDLYRFRSNVEAFERLTSAQSPVHVLVVTGHQDTLFNMTARQLVARLTAAPIGDGQMLGGMQVVVVGEDVDAGGRVHSVSTVDAAVRLVKFGEVESAPMPVGDAAATYPAGDAVASDPMHPGMPAASPAPQGADSGFLPSLISSIWDAPAPGSSAGPGASRPAEGTTWQQSVPQRAPQQALPIAPQAAAQRVQMPRGTARMRGVEQHPGAPARPAAAAHAPAGAAPAQLFAHSAHAEQAQAHDLQPARPYEVPGRGMYRGPQTRGAGVPSPAALATHVQSMPSAPLPGAAAQVAHPGSVAQQAAYPAAQVAPAPQAPTAHPVSGAAVPPGLVGQMHDLVYAPTGAVADPLLGFSSQVQADLARQAQPVQAQSVAFAQVAPQGIHAPQHHDYPVQVAAQHPGHLQAGHPSHLAAQHPGHPVAAQHPGHPVAHAPTAGHHQSAATGGRRLGRGVARMRERIRESERAPLTPNPVQQAHAGQVSEIFDAPQGVMRRAEAAGDVRFG